MWNYKNNSDRRYFGKPVFLQYLQIAAGSPEALLLTGCGIVSITMSIFCKVSKYMSDFVHEIQTTVDDLLHQAYKYIFV